jgi:hypothetical protein
MGTAAWFGLVPEIHTHSERSALLVATRMLRDTAGVPPLCRRCYIERNWSTRTHPPVAPQIANRNRMFDGTSKEARPDAEPLAT